MQHEGEFYHPACDGSLAQTQHALNPKEVLRHQCEVDDVGHEATQGKLSATKVKDISSDDTYHTYDWAYTSRAHAAKTKAPAIGITIGAAGPESTDTMPANAATIESPRLARET